MLIHSIINEYDIMRPSAQPEFVDRKVDGGTLTMIRENGVLKPYSFFSTNPSMYLDKKYQFTEFYN